MSGTPAVRIGRYDLRGELGRGMMGIVYEAHDTILLRPIALKVIQVSHGATGAQRRSYEERFFTEARAAAGLNHAGIIVVHDVGRDAESGVLFLALELLQGHPLDRVLRERGRLEWREACDIVRRVAEALQHAHARGVIHRDIKPANIMLQDSGEPKIMDFGIAKLQASHLTATGQFLGTPLYMAPEQAMSHPVDARSDIFALGAVLYEMVTGRAAFAGESVTVILLNVVSREPEPPTLVAPELPPSLDYVLARCLAKDRDSRYPDARSLALDLEDIVAGRAPRGQAGWHACAASGNPTGPAARSGRTIVSARGGAPPAAPAPVTVVTAKASPRPPAPKKAAPPRRTTLSFAAAGIGLVVVLAGAFLIFGPEPVARRITKEPASPTPLPTMVAPDAAGAPRPTLDPKPSPAHEKAEARPSDPAPSSGSSLLLLEFAHSLRAGTLRVWVDEDQAVERQLDGRLTKEIVGIKVHKGSVSETLEIKPGRREVRVEVQWDDKSQVESLWIDFRPGETYHVEARLGSLGGVRKNLSLGWH